MADTQAKAEPQKASSGPAPQAIPDESPELDETVPGGSYMVDGILVDAHGQPIKEKQGER